MSEAGPVAVVIPARNEATRLPRVLELLRSVDVGAPLLPPIVVDDGSTDDTAGRAEAAGATVIRLPVNRGKGGALLAGAGEAVARGAGVVALMDADGQHRPEDLPALVRPLLAGEADVALGTRRFRGEMPVLYRFGNWLLSAAVRVLYGLGVADSQCGMRAFSSAALGRVAWSSAGYAVETEMLVRIARARLRWVEVPIPAVYLDRAKGTQPSDGIAILLKLIGWRLAGPPPAAGWELGTTRTTNGA